MALPVPQHQQGMPSAAGFTHVLKMFRPIVTH